MFSAFLLTKQKNVTGLFRLRRYILAIIQLPLHVRQMSLLGVIYRADIALQQNSLCILKTAFTLKL